MNFETWKKRVDEELESLYGLSLDDLPDFCYRDVFDKNWSPKRTAYAALKAAGGGR
jgi:hypothetical protein